MYDRGNVMIIKLYLPGLIEQVSVNLTIQSADAAGYRTSLHINLTSSNKLYLHLQVSVNLVPFSLQMLQNIELFTSHQSNIK